MDDPKLGGVSLKLNFYQKIRARCAAKGEGKATNEDLDVAEAKDKADEDLGDHMDSDDEHELAMALEESRQEYLR